MTYRKLQNGDIVDIIAPSSSKDVDLKAIADIVRGFGLTPRIPDNMLLSGVDPFSANTDEFRFNQLKQAIYTEDSKVIWAFRVIQLKIKRAWKNTVRLTEFIWQT